MKIEKEKNYTFMFHEDFPKGEIFEEKEVEKLKSNGWVDSPAKLNIKGENEVCLSDIMELPVDNLNNSSNVIEPVSNSSKKSEKKTRGKRKNK